MKNLIKTTLGAAVLLAAGASQAALTPTGLSCGETVTNPSFTDCAGAFEGNDKNQQADVLATILAEFGLASASYVGASDDADNGPFSNNPDTVSATLNFDFATFGALAAVWLLWAWVPVAIVPILRSPITAARLF